MPATGISQIDKSVPFGSHIYRWLQYAHGGRLETLVTLADQYERRYLAWEQVRKGGNPFLENGTGFEGYFVGYCSSAEEALRELLTVGHEILTNILKLHRFEPRFESNLMDTLNDDVPNGKAMCEWSAEYGAELARLRCNALRNPETEAFRAETYHIVDGLPHIVYAACGHTIKQHYEVVNRCFQSSRIVVNVHQLRSSEQDAWLMVHAIGKFGHPLFRKFMDLAAFPI